MSNTNMISPNQTKIQKFNPPLDGKNNQEMANLLQVWKEIAMVASAE